MNYEERKRVIAEWIEPTRGFLSRFKIPSLSDEAIRAEMLDLVDMLNETTPILPNADALKEFLGKLGREVGKRAKTRGWPMQSEFSAASEAIRRRPAPSVVQVTGDDTGQTDHLLPRKIELAAEWFAKFKQLPGWWNTEAICIGLIEGGHLTYEELKQSHAAVPMRENARHLGAAPVNPKTFGGDKRI